MASTTKFSKSIKCPVCGATVLVKKVLNMPTSVCRSLALANHAQTLHAAR